MLCNWMTIINWLSVFLSVIKLFLSRGENISGGGRRAFCVCRREVFFLGRDEESLFCVALKMEFLFKGLRGLRGALNWSPIMPKNASLSDSRYTFYSLVYRLPWNWPDHHQTWSLNVLAFFSIMGAQFRAHSSPSIR